MKTTTTFSIATLVVISAFSSLAAAEADLPYYGWRLTDFDAIIEKAPNKAAVIKVGEPAGFQANINIIIQRFPGTMKEYIELSSREFDKLFEKKWKFLSEKQDGEKEWTCELAGTSKGKQYQFYARAVKDDAKIYLVTATALQEQWASLGDKMRRQVDGFKAK